MDSMTSNSSFLPGSDFSNEYNFPVSGLAEAQKTSIWGNVTAREIQHYELHLEV